MPNHTDPHALTDGQVIAVAKMLEAVVRQLAPPEAAIADAFIKERDRLVAAAIEKAKDRATADLREVWLLVRYADGFGSPFWAEPGLDDTSPAQAVQAVLKHLRETIVELRRAQTGRITDEQIREVRDRIEDRVSRGVDTKEERELHAICLSALNADCHPARRKEALDRISTFIEERVT